MSAAIASGVVGIGDHSIIDGTYEGGVSLNAQADSALRDGARIGLERCGQQRIGRIAGEDKKQVADVLRGNPVFQQGVVDRISQRGVGKFEKPG